MAGYSELDYKYLFSSLAGYTPRLFTVRKQSTVQVELVTGPRVDWQGWSKPALDKPFLIAWHCVCCVNCRYGDMVTKLTGEDDDEVFDDGDMLVTSVVGMMTTLVHIMTDSCWWWLAIVVTWWWRYWYWQLRSTYKDRTLQVILCYLCVSGFTVNHVDMCYVHVIATLVTLWHMFSECYLLIYLFIIINSSNY